MERLQALSRLIWRSMPDAAAEPLGVITALGSATVLVFGLSLLYWLDERRSTAVVVSYALVALAVVVTVKTAFGLARPPATARLLPLDNDPYGFPSGHAVAAVVVYGGLLAVRDRLFDRRAVVGVAVLVALVGFSRVALGVHYLADVLAGTVLGLLVLGACRRAVGDDPVRGFALAAVVSVPALLVTALGPDALLAFGGSLGGVVGSLRMDAVEESVSRLDGLVLALVGVPFVFTVDELAEGIAEPLLTAAAYAVLVAGILLLPALFDRVSPRSVRRTAG